MRRVYANYWSCDHGLGDASTPPPVNLFDSGWQVDNGTLILTLQITYLV